jgi:2,4-dienoyl-CoA reductase-like NADH-dependent reductase (Old Yellow Enzyme family)
MEGSTQPAAGGFRAIGSLGDVSAFRQYLADLKLDMPLDASPVAGSDSPLAQKAVVDGLTIGNRFTIHPMEGWDGDADGQPTENTTRRWRHFGASGAKLIWGGEAVAICPEGRANPNQLLINERTLPNLARLRQELIDEHVARHGSADGLVVGLQLTHSGRFSRPNERIKTQPIILYHHPLLDRRVGIDSTYPVLADDQIRRLVELMAKAAAMAERGGFDFVDVKHCHGYLGHEFLSARTRSGPYGGSFENRTRFLRECVSAIRSTCGTMRIGVRLSCFDFAPFRPDPATSKPGAPGVGVPEDFSALLPYQHGFGCDENNPTQMDLAEPAALMKLLAQLDISLVNLTAGSPYYNPHIQRPAMFPPSDGYRPPEDPLAGVFRQMQAAKALRAAAPELFYVGTAYTYLQEYLPHVAQAAVRQGWIDSVGIGRMVLAYPDLPADVLAGRPLDRRKICRTFSDCTTAPRNGLPSGCYPLDEYYRKSPWSARLKAVDSRRKID